MSKIINGIECQNLPWEDKPKNYDRPIWRYSGNPLTKRGFNKTIDRVLNSAIVPFNGEFIGIFRGDDYCNHGELYLGHSKDGISFTLEDKPVEFVEENGIPSKYASRFDPRISIIDGVYYITYCEYYVNEVTTAIAKTTDFKHFIKLDNPFTPNYRNGVLFPRKFNDVYKILLRPCDAGDSKFGNIYVADSKDMEYFGKAKVVCRAGYSGWNWVKIGCGPVPIEIEEGWLVFIHGVTFNCGGFIYSIGAFILDKDDPSKMLYQCKPVLLMPTEPYEQTGFTSNVCFPTSVLVDKKTGRMAIYYGAADSTIALAFTTVDEIVSFIKNNSIKND